MSRKKEPRREGTAKKREELPSCTARSSVGQSEGQRSKEDHEAPKNKKAIVKNAIHFFAPQCHLLQQVGKFSKVHCNPPHLRFDSNQSPDWPTGLKGRRPFSLTTDLTVVADAKLQYVISDERPIGFLLSCAEGWKSYDTDGRPIGLFDSEELAAKAVYERAALPSPRH